MGTRNIIYIRLNRRWVVAQYCQWDGYPKGQGANLFDFLHVEGNIARLRAGLAHVYELSEEESATKDLDEFPSLDRGIGAKVLELISNATAEHKVPLLLELDFIADWMSCEWAYIVDMDEEKLKIFSGLGDKEPIYEGYPFEEFFPDTPNVPKCLSSPTFAELQSWDKKQFMKHAADWQEQNNRALDSQYRASYAEFRGINVGDVTDDELRAWTRGTTRVLDK